MLHRDPRPRVLSPRRAAGRLHFRGEQFSSRACVRKLSIVCAQVRVHMCAFAAGAPDQGALQPYNT